MAGRLIPPIAANNGAAAALKDARWPEVSSRLISRPTTKKKRLISK